jgi:aldose 1-epimerase
VIPEANGIALRRGRLAVDVDRRGAVITAFRWQRADGICCAAMRDGAAHGGDPLKASCFPLLPFGNRVRDNRFTFGGRGFALSPNQPWDRHYLHGDGWLTGWAIIDRGEAEVTLGMRHAAGTTTPYAYSAEIRYHLLNEALSVSLTVRNEAPHALPFGLGLHPYFPLTALTKLQAVATGWFVEEAEFMPGAMAAVPNALDFSKPRQPPRHWINSGFTGWNGHARISWPETGVSLGISCGAAFGDYFLFMSDAAFEPSFAQDYFCFEPMTHRADAHHATDLGGLVELAPGAALSGEVVFEPRDDVRLPGSHS